MEETTFVNPYSNDDCEECEEHGKPCIECAFEANGTLGPGFYNKTRALLISNTQPNVFVSMIYWINKHLSEPITLYFDRLGTFGENVNHFDMNVAALGLIGRSHVPSLVEDRNRQTFFYNVNTLKEE